MKLERSIGSLAKKIDRLDPIQTSINKTSLNSWKDKPIIPIDEWIKIRDRPYALNYFPDGFGQTLTYIPENELEKGKEYKNAKKWNSDFIELMEHTRNPSYGKMKCIHCLLSPHRNDPIFTGIDRLVAKVLTNGDPLQYPCEVVNRFQCPYERNNNTNIAVNSIFDVEDLFELEKMAFAVEISLAIAGKEDSRIRVRDKKGLFNALTDKETLTKILKQVSESPEVSEDIRTYVAENRDNVILLSEISMEYNNDSNTSHFIALLSL
ncbi:MAG: hypothetical protein ACRD8W_12800 [Nitrososphaeraceae archaeon]